jgi:hypothetical protein
MPKRQSKPRRVRERYYSKSYLALCAAIRGRYLGEIFADAIYASTNRIGFMRRFMNVSKGLPMPTVERTTPPPPRIPRYDPHKRYVVPPELLPGTATNPTVEVNNATTTAA